MLVIFEGIDGSGKSTIIKKLKERFGWEEVIWPGKQKDPSDFVKMVDEFRSMHCNEIHGNKVYLMDRGGVGEILYGTLENRLGNYSPSIYNTLFDLWKNCVFVICSNEEAHKNAITRGEDGIAKNKDIHFILSRAYEHDIRYLLPTIDTIDYDYSQPQAFEKLAKQIVAANFLRALKSWENKEE